MFQRKQFLDHRSRWRSMSIGCHSTSDQHQTKTVRCVF